MIYVVTKSKNWIYPEFEYISVEESKKILDTIPVKQFDTETDSLDSHIGNLLLMQIGNKDKQIVIDCETIDPKEYKSVLENNLLIAHNSFFDLEWLYNYSIIPRKLYDTMIAEQVLYLGFPKIAVSPDEYKRYNHTFPYLADVNKQTHAPYYTLSFSLKALASKYLGVDLDKQIRNSFNRHKRGMFTKEQILYAAHDVMNLEDIMRLQVQDAIKKDVVKAIKLENEFIPACTYLNWCGIKLDAAAWKKKMQADKDNLETSLNNLNAWVRQKAAADSTFDQYVSRQLNLFDDDPEVLINWKSPKQVVPFIQQLGFNTKVKDKETGKFKDAADAKTLGIQKGVCDEFLDLFLAYKGSEKVVSSFGQNFLNTINPKTGRIYTQFHSIGCSSSRMSCGGGEKEDLAQLNRVFAKDCKNVNLQQLPHDELTRSCFISEEGNNYVAVDYSSQEGFVQADIYDEPVLKSIYIEGKDSHSVNAKIFFKEELKDIDVDDVKKLRPDLRQAAKAPFFALSYGGSASTLVSNLGISKEEAQKIVDNYQEGYKATMEFAKKGEAFVKKNGYIVISQLTGLKTYWWDHCKWAQIEEEYEQFPELKRGKDYKAHSKILADYGRLARNAPSQGTSASMSKRAATTLFNWIIDNGYFNKIKFTHMVHDELGFEYPEQLDTFPNLVVKHMVDAGKMFVTSLDMKAEPAIGKCWIH